LAGDMQIGEPVALDSI